MRAQKFIVPCPAIAMQREATRDTNRSDLRRNRPQARLDIPRRTLAPEPAKLRKRLFFAPEGS
jgi:hypothetical protein